MNNFRSIFRWRRLGLVFIVIGLVSVFGVMWWAIGAKPEHPTTIIFALPEHPPAAPIFVAKQQGYFAQQGLQIEFKRFPSGARALPAMLAGDAQLATAADVPVAATAFTRNDFKVVAAIARADSDARIVARRDRGILEPAHLSGKKIGTQKLSAVHYFLEAFLAKHNITQVVESFFKAEELVDALQQGKIDAFSMREPYIEQARKALGANVQVFTARNLYVRGEYLVVKDELLQLHPGAVEGVLRALIEAEQFIKTYPADSMAIVANELKVSASSINETWSDLEVNIALPQAVLTQLEAEGQWALRYAEDVNGKKIRIPNYLSLITADYLRRIDKKRVSLIE